MRRFVSLLPVLAALGACFPVSTYYREGVTLSSLERDETACEVRALRDVPVANQVRQDPPRYIPGARICDASGACVTRPGRYVPGPVYTVDVNADLRRRVTQQCMADRGYVPVTLPACPPGVAQAAPPGATTRLPKLRPEACAIRNSDGSFQIVNRG
ncbi:MAG: hypothetical protein AAFY38_01065 [Pseudomonadota bacterium]